MGFGAAVPGNNSYVFPLSLDPRRESTADRDELRGWCMSCAEIAAPRCVSSRVLQPRVYCLLMNECWSHDRNSCEVVPVINSLLTSLAGAHDSKVFTVLVVLVKRDASDISLVSKRFVLS